MRWSVETLSEARKAVRGLLEEVGVGDFVFEVEPDPMADDLWLVRVECAGRQGWKATELRVDPKTLERSHAPKSDARLELLEAWRARLLG